MLKRELSLDVFRSRVWPRHGGGTWTTGDLHRRRRRRGDALRFVRGRWWEVAQEVRNAKTKRIKWEKNGKSFESYEDVSFRKSLGPPHQASECCL